MKSEKITKIDKRWYDDACGAAHALEILGERWSLLIVRELMFGPKRFGELRGDLPGISANILTQRLDGLEREGVLIRRRLPPPASTQVYELTPWGYEAEPIFQVLGRWAVRSPSHDPTLQISATSVLLSFRTMIDAARAAGIDARIGFRFGEECFTGTIRDGGITIVRGPIGKVDLMFSGEPAALAAAVHGKVPFDALSNVLQVDGALALAERFATLFPLPPKVDV